MTYKESIERRLKKHTVQAAIERVIDKRHARGASDASIIGYLSHLKAKWQDRSMVVFLDALIAGVAASPSPSN